MKLPNGTLWPDLHRAADAAHALRYSDDLSMADRYVAAEVIAAYLHLVTHPVGTEACVQTLRALRRAARMASEDDAPAEVDPALLAAGNRALVEQVEQLRSEWLDTALYSETRAVLGLAKEER